MSTETKQRISNRGYQRETQNLCGDCVNGFGCWLQEEMRSSTEIRGKVKTREVEAHFDKYGSYLGKEVYQDMNHHISFARDLVYPRA